MLQMEEAKSNVAEDILVSYEKQISTIGILVNNTHGILQESKVALKTLSSQLRETLADSASLRKTDFDHMIAMLESQQEDRHREIMGLLNEFILVHKEAAYRLKGLLSDARSGRMVDFRATLAEIQARQSDAQQQVINQLRVTQDDQEGLKAELQKLLNNGRAVRPKELKAALHNLTSRERIAIT